MHKEVSGAVLFFISGAIFLYCDFEIANMHQKRPRIRSKERYRLNEDSVEQSSLFDCVCNKFWACIRMYNNARGEKVTFAATDPSDNLVAVFLALLLVVILRSMALAAACKGVTLALECTYIVIVFAAVATTSVSASASTTSWKQC